jgi:hypothetical protein
MDRLYEIANSPAFKGAMFNLSVVALVLAAGLVVVGFAFYGRTRETEGLAPSPVNNWTMLFACWRDSLILTLLFAAQGMLYRYAEFRGLSELTPGSLFSIAWIVQPVALFLIDVLIFVVAALRIIALTRWLAQKAQAE